MGNESQQRGGRDFQKRAIRKHVPRDNVSEPNGRSPQQHVEKTDPVKHVVVGNAQQLSDGEPHRGNAVIERRLQQLDGLEPDPVQEMLVEPDDGGKDVFLHISAVERSGIGTPREGQKVSYDLERDQRGRLSATNLRSGD